MALSSTLAAGTSGPDVQALQKFLNANGYQVAPPGQPGSTGMETDYFGPGTVAALQQFQAANGIVSTGDPASTGYGAVGPRTLAAINSYTPPAQSSTPSSVPPTTGRVDPNALYDQYGYNPNQAAISKATSALDGFLGLLSSGAAGQSGLSDTELNHIINDPTQVGFYINALAYGGYTLQDVFKDMTWQQHQNAGTGNMQNTPEPISGNVEAHVYKASPAYQQVQSNQTLNNISPTIAGLDSTVTSVPLLQMPDNAFNDVKPLTMDQLQDQMKNYKDATYEVALEMATASNDAQHTQALADWNSLKTQIEGRLGINLSDNAIAAWNQINNFATQASQRDIAGSGIQDKEVDDYLKQQSQVNQSVRKYFSNYEDQAKANYYQNYASPEEIKSLIGQDPAKAQEYGLIPSDEVKQAMSLDTLKKEFPNTPVDQLQAMINKYLDPSGNFYSKLYGNYAQSEYGTNQNYQTWQASQVLAKASNDAAQANQQYSDPNNPFLKPQGNGIAPTIQSQQPSGNPYSAAAPQSTTPQSTYTAPTTSTPPTTYQAPTPHQSPTQTTPATPTSSTPVKPSSFSALTSLTTNTPNYSSNPNFSGANFSIGNTAPAPKPAPSAFTSTAQQPSYSGPSQSSSAVTSGSGLGGLFSGAVNSVGNFFKGLKF